MIKKIKLIYLPLVWLLVMPTALYAGDGASKKKAKSSRQQIALEIKAYRGILETIQEKSSSGCCGGLRSKKKARAAEQILNQIHTLEFSVIKKNLSASLYAYREMRTVLTDEDGLEFAQRLDNLFARWLKRGDEPFEDEDLCLFCMDKARCVYMEGCYHLAYCDACAGKYHGDEQKCPTCRDESRFVHLDTSAVRNKCIYCNDKKASLVTFGECLITCRDCYLENIDTHYCHAEHSDELVMELFRN